MKNQTKQTSSTDPILLKVPASMLDEFESVLHQVGLTIFRGNDALHYQVKRIPAFIRIQETSNE